MLDIYHLRQYRESSRLEAKEALGGLPESIWETYSGFANADGGIILLGVKELPDRSLQALDLLDPQWLIEDFLAILRDPDRVSRNILGEDSIRIHTVEGRQIIAISVPAAQTREKPVYLNRNPYRETYCRRGDADCRCTREEVDAMFLAAGKLPEDRSE
ncbi:MAG: ATP-binding protein [Oscillospiraceae bacterium]|nr:ATP-binding protein [Oscillospiraceae bacterium]